MSRVVARSAAENRGECSVSTATTHERLYYHAARILLLLRFCGKPQGKRSTALPGVEGRTLLAKLDFFLRYPAYLRLAARLRQESMSDTELGIVSDAELTSVESRMVRFLYGPWDHLYYPVLGYLIGKGLVCVQTPRRSEVFRLTAEGMTAADRLASDPAYTDLAQRARAAYRLFNKFGGTSLKNFIYESFPEVVNRNIGEII